MTVMAGGAALRESATIDEVPHIGAGVSYLQKFDLRLNSEHPPLAKLIAALPLVMRGVYADYSGPAWTGSSEFFPAFLGEWIFGDWVLTRWNEPGATLAWSRLPMLALTLLLGWMVFVYARRMGGTMAGLLCLAAFVTAPVFLTFGPLVLTDTAVTLFALAALWRYAALWDNPSRRNAIVFGVALGCALLSKFSAAIVLLAVLAFAVSTRWWPVGLPSAARRRATWMGIAMAALTVYAVYFVFSWNQPVDIPGLTGRGPLLAVLGRLLMPPWLFLRGFALFLFTSRRPTFILGQSYPHGVWFYFPVVFALKSAPGFIGLLGASLVLGARRRWRNPLVPAQFRTHWRVLWVALVVFTVVCILSPMNISIRHFSIPIVLLTLLLAPLPAAIRRLEGQARMAAAVFIGALAASCFYTSVRAYPFYMPYVNIFSLGRPAYTLVNDSNVDWNQALPEVEKFARRHAIDDVPVDEYGFSNMRPWVPRSRLWNCQTPAAADAGKWVAVSANLILDGHNCAWLMNYPHEALAGGSMYGVRLPSVIPAAGAAGGPPLPAAHRNFAGMPGKTDMRLVFVESCEHPERFRAIVERMAAEFRNAQNEPRSDKVR